MRHVSPALPCADWTRERNRCETRHRLRSRRLPAQGRGPRLSHQGGHEIVDLGAYNGDPQDDYPDFAERVGDAISAGEAKRGILICGSGVGVCVAANKIPGIRAGMCHDTYSAHQGVEHDDMNVIVLGARIIGPSLAYELVDAFIRASSSPMSRASRAASKKSSPSKPNTSAPINELRGARA